MEKLGLAEIGWNVECPFSFNFTGKPWFVPIHKVADTHERGCSASLLMVVGEAWISSSWIFVWEEKKLPAATSTAAKSLSQPPEANFFPAHLMLGRIGGKEFLRTRHFPKNVFNLGNFR